LSVCLKRELAAVGFVDHRRRRSSAAAERVAASPPIQFPTVNPLRLFHGIGSAGGGGVSGSKRAKAGSSGQI
jgi:hypothetical protein